MSKFGFFAAALSVAFVTIHCTIYVRAADEKRTTGGCSTTRNKNDVDPINHGPTGSPTADQITAFLNSAGGCLARENTPVWEAISVDRNVGLGENRIKVAVDYLKSKRHFGMKQLRERLSLAIKTFRAPTEPDVNADSTEPSLADTLKLKHLSVLIVMDYEDFRSATPKWDGQKWANYKVLYALAFWNFVNAELLGHRRLKVQVKISGIVIARKREAAPYIFHSQDENGLNTTRAREAMLKYWRQTAEVDKNFTLDGYHVVAAMTRVNRMEKLIPNAPESRYRKILLRGFYSNTPELPHNSSGTEIDGIIIHDHENFGGIKQAVEEIADVYKNRAKHDWDLERPRELRPFGEPIEAVFPCQLLPESRRRRKMRINCPNTPSCDHSHCGYWL